MSASRRKGPYRFEYAYHTTEVDYYDEGSIEKQTVIGIDEASNFALNGVMQNIRLATFALAVASAYLAYMIYGITGISEGVKVLLRDAKGLYWKIGAGLVQTVPYFQE